MGKGASPFKVGDRVRCVVTSDMCMKDQLGQEYTVTNTNGNLIGLKETEQIVYAKRFELVTPTAPELERLVQTANEGVKAMAQLRKQYRDQVIYQPPGAVEYDFDKLMQSSVPSWFSDGVDVFRVKTRPTFEPFTVGAGWGVRMEGSQLHVGCKQFPTGTAKSILNYLCRKEAAHDGYQLDGAYRKFEAARTGIIFHGHSISWEDADRILTALEKAGV